MAEPLLLSDEAEARAFVAARCDAVAMERLDSFAAALRAESALQNLVARSTLEHIWLRHIADSAQLLDLVGDGAASFAARAGARAETAPWLDLGSGAGPPGLIIAAMRPGWPVVLVESRKRRIAWLERMCDALALPRCRVAGMPLERLESFPAAVISARAFAPMPRLLALSARFSTAQTMWLLPKGRSAAQDLADLPNQSRRMFHVEQSRSDPEAGIITGKFGEKGPKACHD